MKCRQKKQGGGPGDWARVAEQAFAMRAPVKQSCRRAKDDAVNPKGRAANGNKHLQPTYWKAGERQNAEPQARNQDRQTKEQQRAAIANVVHDPGPKKIKLLFHAQGPKVAEKDPRAGAGAENAEDDVLGGLVYRASMDDAEEIGEVGGPKEPAGVPLPMRQRLGEENEEKDGIVQGEDAQGAAQVEVARAVGLVGGVEQDASDEKAGKDEEAVHTDPAEPEVAVVVKENRQERRGAQAVQSGVEDAVAGRGAGGRAGDEGESWDGGAQAGLTGMVLCLV